ncbi:ATP-binding protein [Paenibacillus borealis]|uniref:Sensor histidine kinase NatK-like C-terminal domain-containing protein n=1 Tax=Paenibacillus borealis TaxID=160799 RepID=A0A089L6X7_PAEBO|nr:sensor histidine kinase [Paenibacillus borealis]AIQ56542.1 hypothetical protein PBOR_06015 [Paenibacillus borealis]
MNPALLDELLYLAALPLIPVILHSFFNHCFRCRVQSGTLLILIYTLYPGAHLLLHHSALPDTVLLAANTGLILCLSLLYQGGFKWRIYAALFISALIVLGDGVIPLAYTDTGYRISLLLSKLLMLLLVFLLRRLVKGDGSGHLAGWLWSLLFLCPVLSIAALLQLSNHPFFQLYPQLFPVVPALLLAINFLIFVLSDRVMGIQSERSLRLLLEQQNSYYVNQYHRNREFQEEAFKFRHDFNNILLGLRASIHSGEETASASAAELDALLGWTGQSADYCHTGNPVIDSILDYKQRNAAAEGIGFRLDLHLPPRLSLDTPVISVILGNALDNAIEAARQVNPVPDRYIAVHMHYLNNSLFMRIQNPYSHVIVKNTRGDIVTTKPDKRSHGIGLQNIRTTIENAGGLFHILYSDNLFQLELVLFQIESV